MSALGTGLRGLGQAIDPGRIAQAMESFQRMEMQNRKQEMWKKSYDQYVQDFDGAPDYAKKIRSAMEKRTSTYNASSEGFNTHNTQVRDMVNNYELYKSKASEYGDTPEEQAQLLNSMIANPNMSSQIALKMVKEKESLLLLNKAKTALSEAKTDEDRLRVLQSLLPSTQALLGREAEITRSVSGGSGGGSKGSGGGGALSAKEQIKTTEASQSTEQYIVDHASTLQNKSMTEQARIISDGTDVSQREVLASLRRKEQVLHNDKVASLGVKKAHNERLVKYGSKAAAKRLTPTTNGITIKDPVLLKFTEGMSGWGEPGGTIIAGTPAFDIVDGVESLKFGDTVAYEVSTSEYGTSAMPKVLTSEGWVSGFNARAKQIGDEVLDMDKAQRHSALTNVVRRMTELDKQLKVEGKHPKLKGTNFESDVRMMINLALRQVNVESAARTNAGFKTADDATQYKDLTKVISLYERAVAAFYKGVSFPGEVGARK